MIPEPLDPSDIFPCDLLYGTRHSLDGGLCCNAWLYNPKNNGADCWRTTNRQRKTIRLQMPQVTYYLLLLTMLCCCLFLPTETFQPLRYLLGRATGIT